MDQNLLAITNAEICRENARALARDVGGVSRLAEMISVSPSQMSQIIGPNPVRNMGAPTSRRIEQAFNLPEGWMDIPHAHMKNGVFGIGQLEKTSLEVAFLTGRMAKAAACLRACASADGEDKATLIALALEQLTIESGTGDADQKINPQ